MVLIVLGVCCVGIKDKLIEQETDYIQLLYAILFAGLVGVGYSINAVIMRYSVTKIGFTNMQLNVDGLMVMGAIFGVMFFMTEKTYSI